MSKKEYHLIKHADELLRMSMFCKIIKIMADKIPTYGIYNTPEVYDMVAATDTYLINQK